MQYAACNQRPVRTAARPRWKAAAWGVAQHRTSGLPCLCHAPQAVKIIDVHGAADDGAAGGTVGAPPSSTGSGYTDSTMTGPAASANGATAGAAPLLEAVLSKRLSHPHIVSAAGMGAAVAGRRCAACALVQPACHDGPAVGMLLDHAPFPVSCHGMQPVSSAEARATQLTG
jgi:hypothetical protein